MQHGAWPPIVGPGQGLFPVFRQLHLMKFYKWARRGRAAGRTFS